MVPVIVIMLVVLLVAGGVVLWAAFPARHEKVPGVPWLSEAFEHVADAVPTLDEYDADPRLDDTGSHRR